MNSYNKTKAAVFPCRLCFLRASPFLSLSVQLSKLNVDNTLEVSFQLHISNVKVVDSKSYIIYYSNFAKDHFFYSVLLLCICNKYGN